MVAFSLMTLYGVDVSYAIPQSRIPPRVGFVITRATYGTKRDSRLTEHATYCRGHGIPFGVYHFFVPGDPVAQADAFLTACHVVGIGPGDIVPHIDVEATDAAGKNVPKASWRDALFKVEDAILGDFGDCRYYCNQVTWSQLGKPGRLIARPPWVAHWRQTAGPPATPGGVVPGIWQYRVGPYKEGALHVAGQHAALNAIDHDRCEALPLIPADDEDIIIGEEAQAPPEFAFDPSLALTDEDWQAMRRERDDLVEAEEP